VNASDAVAHCPLLPAGYANRARDYDAIVEKGFDSCEAHHSPACSSRSFLEGEVTTLLALDSNQIQKFVSN
jgi:hypothetical protein